jgi:hypothetical protein
MAKLLKGEGVKTYATYANAVKAAEKIYGEEDTLRYMVAATPEGRFFPAFIGQEALQMQTFLHFFTTN